MVALGWVAVLCHVSTLVSLLDCLQSGSGKREREEGEEEEKCRKGGKKNEWEREGKREK